MIRTRRETCGCDTLPDTVVTTGLFGNFDSTIRTRQGDKKANGALQYAQPRKT